MDLQKNVSLADFTTLRVGGKADYFARAKTLEELVSFYNFAQKKKYPFFLLGGGSNVFFGDAGFRGLVVKNECREVSVENEKINAQSGALLAEVVSLSLSRKRTGLEELAGVPGTIGGALAGNAGVPGKAVGDVLLQAEVYDGIAVRTVEPDFFDFGYRASSLQKNKVILLQATFKLETDFENNSRLRAKDILEERLQKQPYDLPSAGSFFKNPPTGEAAGWYLEQAGCKGWTEGGAKISEQHANFIVNFQNASSSDILNLARRAQKAVEEKFQIVLEPEVILMGEQGIIKI